MPKRGPSTDTPAERVRKLVTEQQQAMQEAVQKIAPETKLRGRDPRTANPRADAYFNVVADGRLLLAEGV